MSIAISLACHLNVGFKTIKGFQQKNMITNLYSQHCTLLYATLYNNFSQNFFKKQKNSNSYLSFSRLKAFR